MATGEITFGKLKWINIRHPTQASVKFLLDDYAFHPLDVDDVLSVAQSPKIDLYPNYIFFVMHFPTLHRAQQSVEIHRLNIFIGPNFVITSHHRPFEVLESIFSSCRDQSDIRRQFMGRSAGYLAYRILHILAKNTLAMLDELAKDISLVEEQIFDELSPSAVRQLAHLRRNILHIRRVVLPNKFVIDTLVRTKRVFLGKDSEVYFDDIDDHIERTWVLLENARELINGLHETNESLVSHRTNDIIRTLTVISVSLLPLNLMAGMYGMNIVGLPYADHPQIFWMLFGGMALIILTMLIFLKTRRWL
jgi:magnesium transporter